MSNNFFDTYALNITTLSPIHIGDNVEFEPTNYIIHSSTNKNITDYVECPECSFKNKPNAQYCSSCDTELEDISLSANRANANYLYTFTPKNISSVLSASEKQQLLSVATKGSLISIQQFFKEKADKIITKASKRSVVSPEVAKKYYEKCGNPNVSPKEYNKFAISQNISTPNDNLAYIPASSLKGAIRTALMSSANKIKKLPLSAVSEKDKRGNTIYKGKKAEELLYSYTKVYEDPFKYLKLADSVPSTSYQTEILEAKNYIKISAGNGGGIPSYMEVIPPKTEFKTQIQITEKFPNTIEDIIKACNSFYLKVLQTQQSYMYAKHGIPNSFFEDIKKRLQEDKTAFLLCLGMHSSAESQTIENLRHITVTHSNKQKETLDHSTSVWFAENSAYKLPFGWCIVSLRGGK